MVGEKCIWGYFTDLSTLYTSSYLAHLAYVFLLEEVEPPPAYLPTMVCISPRGRCCRSVFYLGRQSCGSCDLFPLFGDPHLHRLSLRWGLRSYFLSSRRHGGVAFQATMHSSSLLPFISSIFCFSMWQCLVLCPLSLWYVQYFWACHPASRHTWPFWSYLGHAH